MDQVKRRGRILDQAREVFSRQGYGGADLQEIASRAHVGKATLYREFGSKRGLLLAVVSRGIEELRDKMVAALSRPGPPARVFGRAVRDALSFFDANGALARVLLLEAGELRGPLVARYFELYSQSKRAADAVFAASPPAPALAGRAPSELADLLMYFLAGRVLVWLLTGQKERLSEEADLLLHVYVSGVFAADGVSANPASPTASPLAEEPSHGEDRI